MSSAGMFQTQISAIMAVLAKAAVAEISQLLEEEAAALHQEIRRRNEEIQGLKTRLMLTETELQRVTAEPQRVTAEPQRVTAEPQRCSVGVQVEILMDTSVTTQSWEAQAEKVVVTDLSEEKPHFSHVEDVSSQPLKQEESVAPLRETQEEELGGLEFEMKIEQVEELVDQTLNQVQAEQKHEGQNHREDGSSHLWCSGKAFDRPEGLMESEQHCQNFTDPYVIEDPMTASGLVALENESFSDVNPQDSLRRSTRSDSTPFSRPPSSHSSSCLPKTFSRRACGGEQTGLKPFRCEECGKGFTQKTWLITHRRVHTGEKPFRCEECGKGFTERKRLLTHKLVHTGEKPFRCDECGKGFTERKRLITHKLVHTGEKPFRCQLCGKTFSRQDNCLRHMRLHR